MKQKQIKLSSEEEITDDFSKEIKFCRPEDVPQIVAFAYKTFEEMGLQEYNIDPSFDKLILDLTDAAVNEAVLVKRNDTDEKLLDGVCILKTSETWWSNNKCLLGSLTYVKPEKRSFKLAKAILKAAQEYAIMMGLPLIFDLIGQKDVEQKKKLLKYLGFEELGSIFIFYHNKDKK